MAHHGDTALGGLGNSMPESLRQALSEPLVGATGTYPEGQVSPGDVGAVQFMIGSRNGRIILDFGTPVHWLSMNPCDAHQIVMNLLQAIHVAHHQPPPPPS